MSKVPYALSTRITLSLILTSDNKSTATAQSDTVPHVKSSFTGLPSPSPWHESSCFFHRATQLYLDLFLRLLRLLPLFSTDRVLVHFDTGAIYAQFLHVCINTEKLKYLFNNLFFGPFVASIIYCRS